MNKFYMVWNEGNRIPRHKWANQESAQNEAERLAQQEGGLFYVLEAISVSRKIETLTEKLT